MIVLEKTPKRTARNSSKNYQNLTLIDPKGNRVQATIFNKDIDLLNDTLHIYQSNYISNAYVKNVEERYRINNQKYQWIINSRTIVEEIPDDKPALEPLDYKFMSFKELDAYKDTNSEIDILAVAIRIRPPRDINTSNGPTRIQDIYIVDQCLRPLYLTIWNRFVDGEGKTILDTIKAKPIILARRIKVTSYNGLTLSSRPTSIFIINPTIPASNQLKTWATQNQKILEELIENSTYNPSRAASSSTTESQIMTKICDVVDFLKSQQPMIKSRFLIKGRIYIEDLQQIFYYMSCIGCNKGTEYEKDEKFLCNHCKHMSIAQPHCRAYVKLEDDTGRLRAVLFGSIAEEALNSTAVDLMEHIGKEHLQYVQNIAEEASKKEWNIQLIADLEQLQIQRHKRFNVLSLISTKEAT